MLLTDLWFFLLLFSVAILYSSVGHGGASGYLALMGLFHFSPAFMKPAALSLNIIVSFIAFARFSRTEKLNLKLFTRLAAASIPAAFAGALVNLDSGIYQKILGVILLIPAIRLTGWVTLKNQLPVEPGTGALLLAGGIIGFLSGMIGIGGGILLSPLLIFMGWATIRETALLSSLFIFVNSLSGMMGVVTDYMESLANPYLYIMAGVVLAGGFAGSILGSTRFSNQTLKRILGVVMIIAGVKLII